MKIRELKWQLGIPQAARIIRETRHQRERQVPCLRTPAAAVVRGEHTLFP
jgi:hypothetical protein